MKKIGIIMGSKSDWDVMKEACILLEEFEIYYSRDIVSAHRTPQRLFEYATQSKERGRKVIIAGAGGAAHLPGMIASLTTIPVIGVPIKSSKLNGIDSLLSIVQMPAGIPVASMAIDGAKNAALYAIAILAIHDDEIAKKLEDYRARQTQKVISDRELKI